MVNTSNVIDGRKVKRHPFADREPVGRYRKVGAVLAAPAPIAGSIITPEGEMRYQAGDYVVTDDPPTHAWPVREAVFRLTYLPSSAGEVAEKLPTEARRARSAVKPQPKAPKVRSRPATPRTSFPGKTKGAGEPGHDMAVTGAD